MRFYLLVMVCGLAAVSVPTHAEITKIIQTRSGVELSKEAFLAEVPSRGFVVMGEFHNTPTIQNAQAEIISSKVSESQVGQHFKVMWEFLDFTDQTKIDGLYKDFSAGSISAEDLIRNSAGPSNVGYAPILNALKAGGGSLVGLNLPRAEKQKVINGGLGAIDPTLIPSSHYVGGDEYRARFAEAMGEHVPAEKLDAYFLAQCLTDSVMAYEAEQHQGDLNFIVAGSFHTDFFDGTVARLKKLSTQTVVTLKLVKENDLSPEDVRILVEGDPRYGAFADYIIFTQ